MVKETVSSTTRETGVKKRRKNATTPVADAEVDIYKKVVDFEEKEAVNRSADSDASLYFNTCNNIRSFLSDIHELKTGKTFDAQAKIMEKCTQACVMIAVLKKLNRLEKFRAIAGREALSTEKQKVDSTNLQYQNLLYESAHLMSEFKKCKQFKSKDEDIELIELNEFLSEAPDFVRKPFLDIELNDSMNHELHLARLEYELTQRKKLAELCNALEDEKKKLNSDIVELKNRLEGLGPRLAAVLEATKPLQEHLGLQIDKVHAEHKLASLLPDPLYLLYANTDAYKKVHDAKMSVEIKGDLDEANQWKELQNSFSAQADCDSEPENDQQEEPVEVKKRRHRKASHVDRQEEKKKRLLEVHPLSVQIVMKINNGAILAIQVAYRTQLRIATVASSIECPSNITGFTAREVLSGESVLGELVEGDSGIESPNPSNHYQLQKLGLGSYQSLVHKVGHAYLWAQRICGLDFLAAQTSREGASRLSQTNVAIVMRSIKNRLKSRAALASQLQQLEQNTIPVPPDSVEVPRNSVSSLTKWSSINWQQYCTNSSTSAFIENEIVSSSDLFYSASIGRSKATLQALIAIKNDYPFRSPIFSLSLKYNGDYHAGNCDEIRDMERAVNTGWSSLPSSASWLLSAQLRHLCAFLDVYLESLAPGSFPQSAVFFKIICGRNRRRPFKFRKMGAGIFTQY